ncbi:MAG: hypothetical protein V4561_10120 [Bacteroidota bacterium]
MQNLIYYPNIEIQNERWLKFGLLYLNQLHQIAPVSSDVNNSRIYKILSDQTDLLDHYRPENFNHKSRAVDKAMIIIERYLNNPDYYSDLLKVGNIRSFWENENTHTYFIYEEKFNPYFCQFLLSRNIATQSRKGILVNQHLGAIYMTILADEVGHEYGYSPITDDPNLYNIADYLLQRTAPVSNTVKKFKNATSKIILKIPRDIDKISIEEFIRVRNSTNFKKYQKAFHDSLSNFNSQIENGNENIEFVNSYKNAYLDFSSHISLLSLNCLNFTMGTSILLNSPSYTNSDFFQKVLVQGGICTLGAAISLKKIYNDTKTQRLTRRYLTEINNLK